MALFLAKTAEHRPSKLSQFPPPRHSDAEAIELFDPNS